MGRSATVKKTEFFCELRKDFAPWIYTVSKLFIYLFIYLFISLDNLSVERNGEAFTTALVIMTVEWYMIMANKWLEKGVEVAVTCCKDCSNIRMEILKSSCTLILKLYCFNATSRDSERS